MAMTSFVFHAAQAGSTGVSPWFVGGSLLFVFVALMAALLAFGAGREHS
jgi:hypothetical protein